MASIGVLGASSAMETTSTAAFVRRIRSGAAKCQHGARKQCLQHTRPLSTRTRSSRRREPATPGRSRPVRLDGSMRRAEGVGAFSFGSVVAVWASTAPFRQGSGRMRLLPRTGSRSRFRFRHDEAARHQGAVAPGEHSLVRAADGWRRSPKGQLRPASPRPCTSTSARRLLGAASNDSTAGAVSATCLSPAMSSRAHVPSGPIVMVTRPVRSRRIPP